LFMALVCETVMASSMAELRRRRDASPADMVELRLDAVADLDVRGATAGRKKPVLITCRAASEGGRFAGSEEERLRVLADMIRTDAEFVDIEWRTDRRSLPDLGARRLVLSHHDFSGLPDDLEDRCGAMRRSAPDAVVKVACAAAGPRDLVRLHALAKADTARHVTIGMGSAGLITRACPALFGSEWTFAGQAAPGQLPVADLLHTYRVHSQGPGTRYFAITGRPLGHSASPAMHNAAFAAESVNAVYVAVESDDNAAFLEAATQFGFEGVSVTAPLKTGWAAVGVELDDTANSTGAANTLGRRPEGWVGRNFDVAGFLAPLHSRGITVSGQRCVVLGSGGAERAAAWALAGEGARVEISARQPARAAALAQTLNASTTGWPPPPGWHLLVNATPVGGRATVDETPVPAELHRPGSVVFDMVYDPLETRLLREAAEAGCKTIDGLQMLLAQAVAQFETWTGLEAPVDTMKSAALFLAQERES